MPHELKGFFRACCVDLLNAYNAAWQDPTVINQEDALRLAINSAAPRFWISPEEAARQISRMEKGLEPRVRKNSNKYHALMELYPIYKRLKEKRFRHESTTFVCAFACLEQASRFYISLHRARRIITKINNGEYIL